MVKKKWIVEIAEVHYRLFSAMAEDKEQAKELVEKRAPGVLDLKSLEFSCELERDSWHVAEEVEEETPLAEEEPKP